MYVRKKKLSPFISGAKCQGFGSVEDIFPSKPPPTAEAPPVPECFGKDIVDAETGEPIEILKVRWNVTEGRLSLDTATILAMGTGRLNIKSRAKESGSPSQIEAPKSPSVTSPSPRQLSTANSDRGAFLFSSPSKLSQPSWDDALIAGFEESRPGTTLSATASVNSRTSAPGTPVSRSSVLTTASRASRTNEANPGYQSPTSLNMAFADFGFDSSLPHAHRRHPLVSQYLKTGPAKAMHHIHWDARSNSVRATDEDGNPIDLVEEDVEFSSDEEEAGGDEFAGPERVRADSRMSGLDSVDSTISSAHDKGGKDRAGRKRSSVGGGAASVGGSTHVSSVGSGSKVSKTSKNSKNSKRSGGVTLDGDRDTTLGLVSDAIVVSNKQNWRAIEERYFQELFALAWDYEYNKSLTLEEGEAGGMAQIRQNARAIARLRTKGLRELVQASADEKVKESKRAALEAENQGKESYLAELQRVHDEERRKSRRYLHALEQDQEIVLIRKMTDLGWLW